MAEVDLSILDMPPKERRDKLAKLADVHAQWVSEKLAAAPFHPDGRPDGSDYNLHYADIEASGADEDEFAARAREALNI